MENIKLPTTVIEEIEAITEGSGMNFDELMLFREKHNYPNRMMQKFIVDFFKVLGKERHYIYTTILHLPETYFQIVRRFDWKLFCKDRGKRAGNEGMIIPESYRLKTFNALGSTFHRYDEYDIFMFSERLERHAELTLLRVEELYLQFLRKMCETEMRKNQSIALTHDIIQEYELTGRDVLIVQKYLDKYNGEAKRKIVKEHKDVQNPSALK